MSTDLSEAWRLRNAAAMTLALSEDQMRRAVRAAGVEALVSLIDTVSPALSAGPEWTRTFEPLVERLWNWCDDATLAALADAYRARGMPWMAVTNALSPENGERIRGTMRHPAWARMPAFATA